MALIANDSRLFGLELRLIWRDLLGSFQEVFGGRLMGWLTPSVAVRLLCTDGSVKSWRSDGALTPSGARTNAATFSAVELPEDIVLRRQLNVPAMSDAEVRKAVGLEVRSVSPFAPEELVWGYIARPTASRGLKVEAVLAARKQVLAYLARVPGEKVGQDLPEAWVLADSQGVVVVEGFGEARRIRRVAMGRRVSAGLLVLALLISALVAVSPTAQLRLRAIEAVKSYAQLADRVAPSIRKRESVTSLADRVNNLGEIVSDRIDPLWLMDLITQSLPDDTSLQTLQIQGRKVTISGQTTDAATLMQHLSAQPGIKEVRAPSPALRPLGAIKDTFNIEFTLDVSTERISSASSAAPVSSLSRAPGVASSAASGASSAPVAASLPVAVAAPAPVASAAPSSATATAATAPTNSAVGASAVSGGASFGGASFGGSAAQPGAPKRPTP